MAIPVDADRPRPVPQTRVRTFAGAALLVLLLAACDAAPAACSPGVTAEAAQGIARELAVAGQPAEMTIAEIDSKLYPARPRHGGAWTVQVDATGIYHQASGPVTTSLHWLIDVDMCSGKALVVGQG
jgi:hypothetical protein